MGEAANERRPSPCLEGGAVVQDWSTGVRGRENGVWVGAEWGVGGGG